MSSRTLRINRRVMDPWIKRAGLIAAGALATTAPVLLADRTSDGADTTPAAALQASAAWRDVLESMSAPELPPPGPTESAVVILDGDAIAAVAPDARPATAAAIDQQQASVEQSLVGIGATINFRYRAVVNGFGIRVPTGRLALVAELPEVKAIYPVTYLTPAQSSIPDPAAQPLPAGSPLPLPETSPQTAPPAAQPSPSPSAAGPDPATIALIDAGVHPAHPWLGGAIGPNRLIIGGVDHVSGNAGPEASPTARMAEAHGTELAGLVLRSPALQGLPPQTMPRMLVHRVVAREQVDGRVRPLARSDRVIAALDRAVDPNRDGELADRAEVILLGLARSYDHGGADPLVTAVEAADAAGSLVVAPAGNDGPTFGTVGTIGGPAASERVLTVGGLSSTDTPRVGSLDLAVGPAAASLVDLPLMGPSPTAGDHPIVVLATSDGLTRGSTLRDYLDSTGQSRVVGAIAVVARGGGSLPQKAQLAARAGAVALAVWDQEGAGLFPGIRAGADMPVPVLGLGSRQGAVLVANRSFRGRITEVPRGPAVPGVASFSSRGPTAAGRAEPDVLAPAVDVETAYPGVAGEALTARVSGTSAAAAQVAALALRARVDRPDLSAADVRSLIVQSAPSVTGGGISGHGAGVATSPLPRPITFDPAVVSGRRTPGKPTTYRFTIRDLSGQDGQFRFAVSDGEAIITAPGAPVSLVAGGTAQAEVTIPAGADALAGTVHAIDVTGASVAAAPFLATAPAVVPATTLGIPEVRIVGETAEARVRIGVVRRRPDRVVVSPVHGLGLWLVPADGGTPIRMSGEKETGGWAPGTYRFILTRRQADGEELPAGRYRLRVSGIGVDGRVIVRNSATFSLK
jgi:hypothetical protein